MVLAEVITLIVTLHVLAHWLPGLVGRMAGRVAANTTIGLIWIVPPLVLIGLHGRRPADYGISVGPDWRIGVHFGFWALLIKSLFEGPGFMLWQKYGLPGGMVLLLLAGAAVWVLALVLRSTPAAPRVAWKLGVIAVLLLLPGLTALMRGKHVGIVVLWQLYFLLAVGLGEELLNRGFVQSRLNEVWGRPWTFLGTAYGPGLLWASMIFAVPHIYQIGATRLNPLMAVGAMLGGLFFGLLRERTGSIAAAVIAHGVANAAGQIWAFIR